MAVSVIRLTPEGRKELELTLSQLEGQLPAEAQRIGQARDGGSDPTENLDLRDAMEDLTLLEGRIGELRVVLASAELLEPGAPKDGVTQLGCQVRVRHADGEEGVYRLVSPPEAHPRQGKISGESPIGQAVMGQRAGAEVVANTPAGAERITLLEVF